MNIKLTPKELKVEVISNGEVVKTEHIDKETYIEYMRELSETEFMLDVLRLTSKMMKPISYEFEVKT